jgi:hypothetical protein
MSANDEARERAWKQIWRETGTSTENRELVITAFTAGERAAKQSVADRLAEKMEMTALAIENAVGVALEQVIQEFIEQLSKEAKGDE